MKVNGVSFDVDWTKFKVGWSFFVPCLYADQGKEEVRRVCRRLGYRIAVKAVIEKGVRGLRIWRLR
jgi:hypothetical protein